MTDSTTSYVRSEDVCDIEAERQKKRPCTRSESYSFLASSDSQPNCESSNSQPQPSCTSPAPSYPKETEEDIGDLVNEDSSVVWSCDSPWMPADMDVRSTNAIWATENVFAFCHDRASLDISRDTKGPENTISMAQGPGVASLVGDFNLSGNESNVIPHTDFLIEDATVDNDQVCFGMLGDLSVDGDIRCKLVAPATTPVQLDISTGKLSTFFTNEYVGELDTNGRELLEGFFSESDMSLQLFCNRTDGSKFFSRTTLFVIIYGPMEIFDDVGEYCRQHDAYLQDPIGCDRDVPYRNPHRLDGLDENASTTYQLIAQKGVKEEVVREQVDILAGLEFDEDLPEAEAPAALWTQLYPHQKQALAFMQKRERSWDFKSLRRDLWGIDQDRLGAITFVNNITLDTQYEQPPDFRGGILADQMGLGKSLTIISLIASDFDVEDVGPGSPFPKRVSESDAEDQNSVRATLLVVPPSLLQSWETQLRTHVRRKTLRWFRHHETSKIQNASELRRYEIVMTTFPTISSEFRKRNFADSILFKTRWHRIVLDEAHCIRNFKTTMAKAVCELSARARWALTGTPLQNRLADFASLLRFLRVYPYDDPKMFQIDIINVLKSQGEDIAVGRVKKLIKFIMIRRTQSAIKLPKKTDQVVKLHFTPSELSRYKQAESPIAAMIDDALNSTAQQSGIFIHALARINALRKFCNIGSTASLKEVTSPMFQQPQNLQADISTAQERYDNLVSLGQSSCVVCSSNLEASNVEGLCVGTQSGQAYLTSCMVLLCEACYTEGKESVCSCESPTTCVPEAVITNRALSVPASPASEIFFQDGFPTKIKALGEDLKSSLDEKSVVFSSWTTTLDFVRKMLDKERIPYVQVDGRVPPRKRIAAFDEFRNRQNIKVVLLTIACGAEGLDLTAASRVYLLEPQWNPSVEEQALARIHRLGQKRTVTTIRFAMKDSIEDHVLGIQDRKKHLADLLLSQSQNSTSQQEIAREKLQRLRSLLD